VNTWKAILAVLVIFGAGLVTGSVLTRMSVAKPATATRPGTPVKKPSQLRRVELMMQVQKELNLTPEQRERIEKIIGNGQERISDLWDQVAPEIQDEYDDVQINFYKELTPEQKNRFDELMKAHQQHRPGTPPHNASKALTQTNSPQPKPATP
jgi:Spy/CpxP family protein refolding chaperone